MLSKASVDVNADDFPTTKAGMNVSGRLSAHGRLGFVSFVCVVQLVRLGPLPLVNDGGGGYIHCSVIFLLPGARCPPPPLFLARADPSAIPPVLSLVRRARQILVCPSACEESVPKAQGVERNLEIKSDPFNRITLHRPPSFLPPSPPPPPPSFPPVSIVLLGGSVSTPRSVWRSRGVTVNVRRSCFYAPPARPRGCLQSGFMRW